MDSIVINSATNLLTDILAVRIIYSLFVPSPERLYRHQAIELELDLPP
jgi:hypothetical protein